MGKLQLNFPYSFSHFLLNNLLNKFSFYFQLLACSVDSQFFVADVSLNESIVQPATQAEGSSLPPTTATSALLSSPEPEPAERTAANRGVTGGGIVREHNRPKIIKVKLFSLNLILNEIFLSYFCLRLVF